MVLKSMLMEKLSTLDNGLMMNVMEKVVKSLLMALNTKVISFLAYLMDKAVSTGLLIVTALNYTAVTRTQVTGLKERCMVRENSTTVKVMFSNLTSRPTSFSWLTKEVLLLCLSRKWRKLMLTLNLLRNTKKRLKRTPSSKSKKLTYTELMTLPLLL